MSTSFICRRCGRDLRELLIGDGQVKAVVADQHPQGQPGIVWYINRLRETAYRQSLMERNLGAKSSREGYDLLGDRRAISLLGKIHATLSRWDARLDRLSGPHSHEKGSPGMVAWPDGFDGLDGHRAARLAGNIPALRHRCHDIENLVRDLADYAKTAWRIINRPDDICCGPCANVVHDKQTDQDVPCGTMLYAEEHAEIVQCPKCRMEHDVSALRLELKRQVRDIMFSGPELLRLMETRLNDRMPKSTFYQLIRDGRLQPRGYNAEDTPLYTYDDVCAAREKVRAASIVKTAS